MKLRFLLRRVENPAILPVAEVATPRQGSRQPMTRWDRESLPCPKGSTSTTDKHSRQRGAALTAVISAHILTVRANSTGRPDRIHPQPWCTR